jgi:hypothetical protein
VDEATIAYYSEWTDAERIAWARRMYAAGFVSDPNDIEGAYRAWATAVDRASAMWENGRKKLTPWQAMDIMEGINPNGGPPAPKTSTNYNIPSAEDAAALVTAVFKGALGRDPNDAELSRYRSMLTGKAKANPTVSTMTTDQAGNTSTTTTGGYSAYQAATTYFNALVSALGAPG